MVIRDYFINIYYSINGYLWLLYSWLFMAILLMPIGGYYINGYSWLLY
jgi:hypothetical protein